MSKVTTEIVTTVRGLDALQLEWDQLLGDSRQQAYFLRWYWIRAWWRYFAPAWSRLYIVLCRDGDGRLMGIAPFYWRQRRLLNIPLTRELVFLGMGITLKSSEYMDIIARSGDERAVASAIADALTKREDWDRVLLQHVPEESCVLPHFIGQLNAPSAVNVCDRSPYIDTSVGWDAFKRSLGRSMRRNVEYYPRRLFKRYSCEFRRIEAHEDVDPAIDALVHLHGARWQASGFAGAFSSGHLEPFLREAAHDSFTEGRLRLWILKIAGQTQAVLLGFLDNGVMHYFQKGFNPAFANEDLGTAVVALCVRDCFDDPQVRAFDFMGGGAAYKEMWARVARQTVLGEARRRNLRTAVFAASERLQSAATMFYRSVAPVWFRSARRRWRQRSGKAVRPRRLTGHARVGGSVAIQ
jgi:CelD/BcsL family acetyltransferase involved in cellulose biosynthesis